MDHDMDKAPQPTLTVWKFRESSGFDGSSLIGFAVEAIDGKVGTIDEASIDTDSSHLVVDTGFWIFGTRRLIPAGVVAYVDPEARSVAISLTKAQVKDAPDWDHAHAADHSDQTWRDRYASYYGPYGW